MRKSFAIWGAIFALTATGLGALGAHSLKPLLSPEHLESFKTGVQYQFYHGLALLFVSLSWKINRSRLLVLAGYLFITGCILFSGSIYILSTTEVSGLTETRLLGPVTPLGGLSFMTGWLLAIISFLKYRP